MEKTKKEKRKNKGGRISWKLLENRISVKRKKEKEKEGGGVIGVYKKETSKGDRRGKKEKKGEEQGGYKKGKDLEKCHYRSGSS